MERTVDLMKKGLRHQPGVENIAEEWTTDERTVDLMKKGLRQKARVPGSCSRLGHGKGIYTVRLVGVTRRRKKAQNANRLVLAEQLTRISRGSSER